MGVASGPAGGHARDPDPAPARDTASPQVTGAACIKEAEGSIEGRELPRVDSRIPEAVRNFM